MTQEELAAWFDRLGVACIAYHGKGPTTTGWQIHKGNDSQKFIRRNGKQRNIGLLLGEQYGGCFDFDLDFESFELESKAYNVLAPYHPVWVGRGGRYRHAIFRGSGRKLTDTSAVRKASHSKGGHVEWRRGGTKASGEPLGCQSFIIGVHPNGEELEFMDDSCPETADDIPALSWEQAEKLWAQLKETVGLEEPFYDPDRVSKSSSEHDWGDVNVASLGEMIHGMAMSAGSGNPCPLCWDIGDQSRDVNVCHLSPDLQVAKCWHIGSCPSNSGMAWRNGLFGVPHVLAYHLGLDIACDWEAIEEAVLVISEDGYPLRAHTDWDEWIAGAPDPKADDDEEKPEEPPPPKKKKEEPKKPGKKKKEPKKKSGSDSSLEDLMATAVKAKDRFMWLWGKWYQLDKEVWFEQNEEVVRAWLRRQHKELVAENRLSYIYARAQEECAPNANDFAYVPPERIGGPVEIHTGDALVGIPFQNGVITLDPYELAPDIENERSRELFYPYSSPLFLPAMDGNHDINKAGVFIDFAADMLGFSTEEIDEAEFYSRVSLLLSIIGSAMSDNRFQKAVILKGAGGRGKDTLFNITDYIIGRGNCSSMTLNELLTDKFAKAELRGKKLLYLPELEDAPDEETSATAANIHRQKLAVFKQITGQSLMRARLMYKQGEHPFRPSCSVWASSNDLQCFALEGEDPEAWGRRLVVIECARQKPQNFEANPDLLNDMRRNGDFEVIAECALWEYWDVIKSRGRWDMTAAVRESIQSLSISEAEKFLDEFVKVPKDAEDSFLTTEEIVDTWNDLMFDSVTVKKPDKAVNMLVKRFGASRERRRIDGEQHRGLAGIWWKYT